MVLTTCRLARMQRLVLWLAVARVAGGCGDSADSGRWTIDGPLGTDGHYVVQFADLHWEITAAGARMTDVRLRGGTNLLTTRAVNGTNFGSTFWTSPQSAWGWPPPAEIDTLPYAATVSPSSLSFVGPVAPRLGVAVSKHFTPDLTNGHMLIRYTLTAHVDGNRFAPWEVTRVGPGGLTFFPTGNGPPRAGGTFALPPTMDAAGCTWYQHQGAPVGSDQKLLADGAGGWVAHLAGDVLLVKAFDDIPADQVAPGEAEIEIFVEGQGKYVEVEEQGSYLALSTGQPRDWEVTWIVRRLPAGLSRTPGSTELVAFVNDLVQAIP